MMEISYELQSRSIQRKTNICIEDCWGTLLLTSQPLDMTVLKVVYILLLAAVSIHSQSFHLRNCPKPSLQDNFNVTKYLGTWHEIKKLPAMFEKGKCVQATYSLRSDGSVRVYNTELLSDGKINSIEGVAKIEDPTEPAILSVSFFRGLPDSPYMVLSTDYTSFSLVYSCSDYLGLFHVDFAWILSRSRDLSNSTVSDLQDTLTQMGIDIKRLSITDQTDCETMASV